MEEIYIITMNWWQLALYTIAIAVLSAILYELLPRVLKKWLDKLESKERIKE